MNILKTQLYTETDTPTVKFGISPELEADERVLGDYAAVFQDQFARDVEIGPTYRTEASSDFRTRPLAERIVPNMDEFDALVLRMSTIADTQRRIAARPKTVEQMTEQFQAVLYSHRGALQDEYLTQIEKREVGRAFEKLMRNISDQEWRDEGLGPHLAVLKSEGFKQRYN